MGGSPPEVIAAATEEGPPLEDDGVAQVAWSVLAGRGLTSRRRG
jgi:hypothetical protein